MAASPMLAVVVEPAGLALEPRAPWMAFAACGGRTSLFFGPPYERPERRRRREATAATLCAGCPVGEPCRDQARRNRESGYWGGETEEQRAAAGFAPLAISRRAVRQAAVDSRVVGQDSCAG